ncbi:hypothetical protein PV327_008502 [Microctonus hyperodae]|uniref:Uncharacterized protein n=1 Tax=Microctonus hyperodae TaxID=165561 RepID=A0AA39F3A2_MICHY|nr:hypothetical protein PV327_008502 [Microctonus hyperodae]
MKNNIGKHNDMRIHETTTAEPKHESPKTTIVNNSSLSSHISIITKNSRKLDATTPLSLINAITKVVHYTQSVESSTENLQSSTTAIPIILPSAASGGQRQFDILSFMGGSLFTFCLMAIGVVLWKAYKMRIERNYRTI